MGALADYGIRGILSQLWRGKSTIPMKLNDPRLAAIMQEYFGENEEKALRSPYRQLPVVYSAITAKARNLSKVPFKLYQIGSKEPLENHPLVHLFSNPNIVTSTQEFWQAIVISLDIGGEFFVYPDPAIDKNGVPLKLWVFPPGWVDTWKNKEGQWLGWVVRRGKDKAEIAYDEMIHGKYWNPDDELRGLAPMKALLLSNGIDWNAMRYSRLFFQNDATPNVVIESEHTITAKQKRELMQELYEQRKGVEKAHSFLILGAMTAKTISPTNKDIQLIESLNMSIDRVCMVFGVPKTELALYGDVNRATSFTQDRSFVVKTLMPLGSLIEGELNRDFLKNFGIEGHFDWNSVDAIRYALLDKVDAAVKLVSIGFTANEVNERLDLGFEEKPWRDEPLAGGEEPEDPEPEESKPEEKPLPQDVPREEDAKKSVDLTEALMYKKWKRLNDEVAPLMAKAASRMRAYFNDVERKLRSRISKQVEGGVLKTIVPDEGFEWVEEAFSDERIQKALGEVVKDATGKGVRSIQYDVGRAFGIPDTAAASAITRRVNKLTGINRTAVQQVINALRTILAQTIEEGVPEDEAARRLLDGMRDAMSVNMHRAKTIARTETHGAYSDGRWEGMHLAGIKNKRWISSRDDKVRDSHEEYEQMGPIPLDDEFAPGLKRPHDPDCDDAGDVINCRCKCVADFNERE